MEPLASSHSFVKAKPGPGFSFLQRGVFFSFLLFLPLFLSVFIRFFLFFCFFVFGFSHLTELVK